MLSRVNQAKIERYRLLLREPYWELREAAYYMCGGVYYSSPHEILPKTILRLWKKLCKVSRPVIKEKIDKKLSENICKHLLLLHEEIDAFRDNRIMLTRSAEERQKKGLSLKGCLVSPYEILSLVVQEGCALPEELQIASGIYQIKSQKLGFSISLTVPQIKKIKREAIAQTLFVQNPKATAYVVMKEMDGLKQRYDYLYRGPSKAHPLALQAKNRFEKGSYVCMEIIDGVPRFDFVALRHAAGAISQLLRMQKNCSKENVISDPALAVYVSLGGEIIGKIIRHSLGLPFFSKEELEERSWIEECS